MDGGGAASAIGQPGGMPHQVQHSDRARRRHRLNRPLPGAHALVQHRDAAVAELRQEPLDRIGQAEAPFLQQQQRGYAGDWLGHRCDGEQRIERHRRAPVRAEMADGFVEHQTPVPRDSEHRARQAGRLRSSCGVPSAGMMRASRAEESCRPLPAPPAVASGVLDVVAVMVFLLGALALVRGTRGEPVGRTGAGQSGDGGAIPSN